MKLASHVERRCQLVEWFTIQGDAAELKRQVTLPYGAITTRFDVSLECVVPVVSSCTSAFPLAALRFVRARPVCVP